MMENPLVSIVILNRNKKEKSLRCIESVFLQHGSSFEVIFVDNASRDGSVEAVRSAYPKQVKLIERQQNSVTRGRNEGFKMAQGQYVLSLDNDILLPDPYFIRKSISLMKQNDDVAVLTAKIASPEAPDQYQSEHWWHPFDTKNHQDSFFYSHYFPEAAAVFRRSVLEDLGGYDEAFFMGFEQAELGLRLTRSGWRILYCPNLVCVEDDTRSEFASRRHPIHYYNLRNKLWTAWKHYPLGHGILFGLSKSIVAFARGCRFGYPDSVVKAMFHGVCPPREVRQDRTPMSHSEWRHYTEVRRGELVDPDQAQEWINSASDFRGSE